MIQYVFWSSWPDLSFETKLFFSIFFVRRRQSRRRFNLRLIWINFAEPPNELEMKRVRNETS